MSETNPAQPLLNLIEDWGLDDPEIESSLKRWPDDQVEKLVEHADAVLKDVTTKSLQILNNRPDSLVLYPESRLQTSSSFLRRCLLYADFTVLPIYIPLPGMGLEPFGYKNQVAIRVSMLAKVAPFLRSGLFLPVSPVTRDDQYNSKCQERVARFLESKEVQNFVRKNTQLGRKTVQVNAIGPDGSEQPITLEQIHAGFDKHYIMSATVKDLPPGHTFSFPILPSGSFAVPTQGEFESRKELQEAVEKVVSGRLQSLLHDWQVGTGLFKGHLVTQSPISWQLLKDMEEQGRQRHHVSCEQAFLELDLPFLDNVPAELIVEERAKSGDELAAFRQAIRELARKISDELQSEGHAENIDGLRHTLIHEPLRALDAKLREINLGRFGPIVGGVVCCSSVLGLTIYGGQSAAAEVAPALLAGTWGPKIVDSISKLLKERASLAHSPLYLLWRLKRASRKS